MEADATGGVPIARLAQELEGPAARKLLEAGVHALWAVELAAHRSAGGPWTAPHHVPGAELDGWQPFWDRLATLEHIGALWWEPWLFDATAPDAEPLFPTDLDTAAEARPPRLRRSARDAADITTLADRRDEAAELMTQARPRLRDQAGSALLVPLPLHHQPPALRAVARLTVEPDTPAARLSWSRRRELLEGMSAGYGRLVEDLREARVDRVLGAAE